MIFSLVTMTGCGSAVMLVWLVSRQWLMLSIAVMGPPPGISYSYWIAAANLQLHINIPVCLLVVIDRAMASNARDLLAAAWTTYEDQPNLSVSLLDEQQQRSRLLREVWCELLSAVNCLLYEY